LTADDTAPGGSFSTGLGCGVQAISSTVFSAGYYTENNNYHWLVRKGANSGVNWSVSEDFGLPAPTGANSVGREPVGLFGSVLYAVGGSGSITWRVRKSLEGGGSWTDSDTFSPPDAT